MVEDQDDDKAARPAKKAIAKRAPTEVKAPAVALPGMSRSRQDPRPRIASPILLGLLAIAVFFGGFVSWAARAPLSSAAMAVGQVAVDTNRKAVQHLEGGIVRRLAVREGQYVKRGAVLLELDATKARSNMILLRARIVASTEQLRLLQEEIKGVEVLYRKGLAHKPRLLGLQRRRAELEGQRLQDHARMAAARDDIRRSKIRAPITGTVVGLKIHTRGGVISPGAELMAIVPETRKLVIEARIDPNDIDIVRKGLSAHVRITPYSARLIPPIPGKVLSISADRFTDERSGAAYYLARVELERPSEETLKKAPLYPGMPVEVMIVTGDRTLLDYMLNPIIKSFGRAFREG